MIAKRSDHVDRNKVTEMTGMNETTPLVSVLCATYKHEKFIREALDGFLMQRTAFAFEVIVHDDASPDATAAIIQEYADRHPTIIRPILQSVNQRSLEHGKVMRTIFAAARGKYIAYCEGDDYWVDPLKLQTQVDLLEANPGFSACVTDSWTETDGIRLPTAWLPIHQMKERKVIVLEDLLDENPITTATLVLRRDLLLPLPAGFWASPAGDWYMAVRLAGKGPIGYIDKRMVVRTRHPGGAISMKDQDVKLAFTAACIAAFRPEVPPEHNKRLDGRVAELRSKAMARAFEAGGLVRARQVWSGFKGHGLPLRLRLRWWLLLHAPRLMRLYARSRS